VIFIYRLLLLYYYYYYYYYISIYLCLLVPMLFNLMEEPSFVNSSRGRKLLFCDGEGFDMESLGCGVFRMLLFKVNENRVFCEDGLLSCEIVRGTEGVVMDDIWDLVVSKLFSSDLVVVFKLSRDEKGL